VRSLHLGVLRHVGASQCCDRLSHIFGRHRCIRREIRADGVEVGGLFGSGQGGPERDCSRRVSVDRDWATELGRDELRDEWYP
jgi:hypothetical protein